jgi:hypothetical protein
LQTHRPVCASQTLPTVCAGTQTFTQSSHWGPPAAGEYFPGAHEAQVELPTELLVEVPAAAALS